MHLFLCLSTSLCISTNNRSLVGLGRDCQVEGLCHPHLLVYKIKGNHYVENHYVVPGATSQIQTVSVLHLQT